MAGSHWYIDDSTTYRIRIGRYSAPVINADNCIEASQAGQTTYTAEHDGWYAVSVFYVDTTQVATETILEQLKGYNYNEIISFVSNNTELFSAISNPTIEYIYLLNNINVGQQLNISGNKTIEGNGYTLTGSNNLTYLIRATDGKIFLNNLKLNTAYDDVLYVGNYCDCYVKNCEIYYSINNDGIGTHGNANCYIYDTIIHDNYDEGLSTHDTSYAECYNVEAYNNGYEIGTTTPSGISFGGLHFGGSRMGLASHCNCHHNSPNGIGFITIDDNFSSSAITTCDNNICHDNVDAGIRFGGATNISCFNNMCYKNVRGILFYNKSTHGNTGYVGKNSAFGNTTGQITVWTGGDDGLVFEES